MKRFAKAFIVSLLVGMLPATPGMSTLQNYSGLFYTPSQYPTFQGFPVYGTFATLDATNDQAIYFMRVYKTGTITRVGFVTGTVTTGGIMDASIQGIAAASGNDGIVNGSSVTFTIADADDNTVVYSTGNMNASVTYGQNISINLAINSASSGNMVIRGISANSSINKPWPYGRAKNGASTTDSAQAMAIFVEYSDGSYAFHNDLWPAMNIVATSFNTGSTPDEYAMKFQFPFPGTYEGMGGFLSVGSLNTVVLTLYDSDGSTILARDTIDTDQIQGTAGRYMFFRSTNTASISANTNYYASIMSGSASGITIYSIQASTNTAWATPLNQMEGGTSVLQSTRTDSGSWGDAVNRRPLFTVGIKAFDDATGSGSGGGGKVYYTP